MTIEEFELMEDHQKVQLIFDANKVTEKIDNEANYQLFQIGNFYVETKTSLEGKFKRAIKTYTLKQLPVDYVGEVLKMPIVKLNDAPQVAVPVPEKKRKVFNKIIVYPLPAFLQ